MKSILFTLLLISGCTGIPQSSTISGNGPKTLELRDRTYEPQIRTAIIYPFLGTKEDYLLPSVTPLGQWNLRLEFDDLSGQQDDYYATVIHCNQDWTKSDLMNLDYLADFNEFRILNAEFSTDTHVPYIHYWLPVPPVKLPGNYVLVVYRGSDRDDIILSKRFMVYDNRISLTRQGNILGPGHMADLNQQLNFIVNYKNVEIMNPMQDVAVTIRQNHRWDNITTGVKPSFIREGQQELEYRFFDPEKMFKGGNEFRFFDIRSLNYPGRNVERVNKTIKPYEVYIFPDKSRKDEAYAQYNDLNGNFIIDNLDHQNISSANYVYVNFTLASAQPVNGSVYVTGAFNHWNLNEENEMHYNATNGKYEARMMLKQGWYDYQYLVKSATLPSYFIEGSYFETENAYEILVYYRPFQPRADLLIGYFRLIQNQR